jgi:hypothetical protein
VTHVTVSGTRVGMTKRQLDYCASLLRELPHGTEFHHGDCKGLDAEFDCLVRERCGSDRYRIHIHPPTLSKDRAFCKSDEDYVVLHDTKDYLKRNRVMVDACHIVYAFPKSRVEQKRGSGTWAVIRYAKKIGKPCQIVFP